MANTPKTGNGSIPAIPSTLRTPGMQPKTVHNPLPTRTTPSGGPKITRPVPPK